MAVSTLAISLVFLIRSRMILVIVCFLKLQNSIRKHSLILLRRNRTLSNMEYTPIKNAIIDSRKDEHRLARSVNYCRKRLKELGKIEEAEEVKRFLFKPDNNYRITYVAAGVSSRENVDDAIELGFSGEELEIRKNELIFYVHGQKLMELAHNIYQRCCK